MSIRLKPASAQRSTPATQGITESVVLVTTETTANSPAVLAGVEAVPVKESSNFMTKNYLWAYMLIVIIVIVVIFWYSVCGCRADEFDKLHCKGVEWIKGSSGRAIMGLFLVVGLLLLAWACSSVSGMYRCAGDMNRCNVVMGAFGIIVLMVLITFILFFRGNFAAAYYLSLFTLLLAVLMCMMFCYYKFTGAGMALGLFALWALFTAWVSHKISCQNNSHHRKGGTSGSGNGSPHRVANRSPY